jgi:VCBS repeat-containing protein
MTEYLNESTDFSAIKWTFDLEAQGTVSFDWRFQTHSSNVDDVPEGANVNDTGFYVLTDSNGNIVDLGKIADVETAELSSTSGHYETDWSSGSIAVPDAGEYTVYFGIVQMPDSHSNGSALRVGDIGAVVDVPGGVDVPSADGGNAVFDVLIEGGQELQDVLGADDGADYSVITIDHEVTGNGSSVPNGSSVQVEGSYGVLTMDSEGNFSYTATDLDAEPGSEDVFEYTLEDGDGDTSSAYITAHIVAPLIGDDGDNTLTGADEVNDILVGGAGDDQLTGGSGDVDTFAWGPGHEGSVSDPNVDTITDFTAGEGGDVLHLGDLVQDSSALSSVIDGGNTTISVNPEGGGVTLQIVLTGVEADVTQLLADGNIDLS